MEIRLAKEKSEQGIDNAMYLRQYGYKISYDAFCKQKFRPDYYFIYLNEKVKDAPPVIIQRSSPPTRFARAAVLDATALFNP